MEGHTLVEVDHRMIFDRVSAPCLVVLPDAPRFTVVAASDAYLCLARATREDSVGSSLLDGSARRPYLLAEAQLEALRSALDEAVGTRSVTRILLEGGNRGSEVTGARATKESDEALGRDRWAIVNTPVISETGELRYLLHRVERVKAGTHESGERGRSEGLEQILEDRTRELQNATGELDALSYSVSHDLRAPLRAINGFSQALAHDYAQVLDERAQHYLDRVSAGAQRMSDLIDDMLELSRIAQAPLRKSMLDVTELARRFLGGLAKEHPDRNVDIEVAPGLRLYADPHLMGMALEKLLDNAWKFTAKNRAARIQVGRVSDHGRGPLFIADDGVGFDMAYAGRLFSPFQRLHKASDFEGTGIGLAVVHRIVSRHGGRIWAEAEVGAGAKFCITLGAGDE
jgi:signal transduction histidine kinase